MSISSDYSLADIAAATGNNGNNNGMGWGGDWSAWIIIFLIFAAFGWGGNGNGLFGGGSRGAADNYVLASDFSMLSRQMSDGFASQERQNQFLISQLGYQCPKPAYVVQPPQQVTFPTNCCGGVNYAGYNNGCGCGCGCN